MINDALYAKICASMQPLMGGGGGASLVAASLD